MCYPCISCGKCGRFDEDSPLFTLPPSIPCFECGGDVDPLTGVCSSCGSKAFEPIEGGGAGYGRTKE